MSGKRGRSGRKPQLDLPTYREEDGQCVCQACCAYFVGEPVRSVARVIGCSHEWARQLLIDHGMELRGRGRRAA